MKIYTIKRPGRPDTSVAGWEAFTLDGVDYPADWLRRGGTIPGATVSAADFVPPQPPARTQWWVGYATALERMNNANAESFAAWVDGLGAKRRERIKASGIQNTDGQASAQIVALGEDPDIILAE